MDRRDFFGCIGKMLMVGAVTVVAPEILTPEPEAEIRPWTDEEVNAFLAAYENQKPDFALAA